MTRLNLSSHLGQDEAYCHQHLSAFHLAKETYQVREIHLFVKMLLTFASKDWDYGSNSLRLRFGSIAVASSHKRVL